MLANAQFLLVPATAFLVLVSATLSITVQALPAPVLDIRQDIDNWDFQPTNTWRGFKLVAALWCQDAECWFLGSYVGDNTGLGHGELSDDDLGYYMLSHAAPYGTNKHDPYIANEDLRSSSSQFTAMTEGKPSCRALKIRGNTPITKISRVRTTIKSASVGPGYEALGFDIHEDDMEPKAMEELGVYCTTEVVLQSSGESSTWSIRQGKVRVNVGDRSYLVPRVKDPRIQRS
ncbi:hypothetical protein P691DRAFT_782598 [Macrolepiota fuliginosa MF-IS2]|uniref:Uncharacterized protein n=1 Tax=Macrolepiota fuliginosa MF-IS2 TaxID=1400762 RepID=A0A9P5WWK8_9AGAR|nr:hypothetical protein P691DRAFT_782598 [Macrolepiota fuliginosa MF-IS2]